LRCDPFIQAAVDVLAKEMGLRVDRGTPTLQPFNLMMGTTTGSLLWASLAATLTVR